MIEKLLKLIGKLPYDKALHFIIGALVFAVSFPIFGWYALAITASVAVIKEFYDRFTPNHVSDIKDAIATLLGALVVAIPLMFQGCSEQVEQWGDTQVEGQHEKAMELLGGTKGTLVYKASDNAKKCLNDKLESSGYWMLQDEIDCLDNSIGK